MAKQIDDSFFELLNPTALQFALLSVWADYTQRGLEPGSERYVYDDIEWGPRLFNDVKAAWKQRVLVPEKQTDDPSNFPFTLSFVRKSFVQTRKFNNTKKIGLCEMYGIAYPDKSEQAPADEELLSVDGD